MDGDLTSVKVSSMSYGGFRRNDNFGPKPVETGKEYDVQITEISRKGDGIARIQGFVIFVKNGKVGQNAKIRVVQVGNRFATAEIVDGEASAPTSTTSSSAAESSSEQVTS
jgi:predicted RNA-binding protein with TRAM domain